MSTTLNIYTHLAAQAFRNKISNLNSPDTVLKMMLLNDGYLPESHTHKTVLDVKSYEIQGDNYNAGGKKLEDISLTLEHGVTTFEASNVEWQNSTLEFRYLVVYDDTPEDETNKNLLFYADFGKVIKTRSSEFAVRWDDEGIFNIAVTLRAEIITDVPVFTASSVSDFTIATAANDYEGTIVKAYFDRPKELTTLEYQEQDPMNPNFGQWFVLSGNAFGPSTGFPLTNTTSNFRASFSEAGTYDIPFSIIEVETEKTLIAEHIRFQVEANSTT